MQQLARPNVEALEPVMMARKSFRGDVQGYAADVSKNARPLSPGSCNAEGARIGRSAGPLCGASARAGGGPKTGAGRAKPWKGGSWAGRAPWGS